MGKFCKHCQQFMSQPEEIDICLECLTPFPGTEDRDDNIRE